MPHWDTRTQLQPSLKGNFPSTSLHVPSHARQKTSPCQLPELKIPSHEATSEQFYRDASGETGLEDLVGRSTSFSQRQKECLVRFGRPFTFALSQTYCKALLRSSHDQRIPVLWYVILACYQGLTHPRESKHAIAELYDQIFQA